MRLSEHERRVLTELEADLAASDRRFVRRFSRAPMRVLGSTALPPSPAPPAYGRLRCTLSALTHWRA